MIYEWIFCYKDERFHLNKIKDLKFPFHYKRLEDIVIERKTLKEWIKELSERVLHAWNLNGIVKEYNNLLRDGWDEYGAFWYIIKEIFEQKYKVFPYIHENIENALKALFYGTNYKIEEKIALGFSIVFALYRIYRLEERVNVKIV